MKRVVLAVLLLFLASPSWAAVTCSGASVGIDVPTNPQNQSFTMPAVTDSISFFAFATRNGARQISAATIAALGLTQVGTFVQTTNTSHEIYYRLNVASGSQTLAATWDGVPLSYVPSMLTCSPVDQSTPISASNVANGSGTAVSVSCSSAVGQLVLGFIAANGNSGAFTAAGHTIVSQANADSTLVAGTTTKAASAGTTSMTATITSADWSSFCVVLNELATSLAGPLRRRMS